MVDVPVDDGDALGAVRLLGMASGDSRVVEQAETHCGGFFGMVAGRPGSDENIVGSAGKHIVHGGVGRTDGSQRRQPAFGADRGIGVDAPNAFFGDSAPDLVDEGFGVGIEDRGGIAFRRLGAVEGGKLLVLERPLYGAQAVRPLRMARRRQVLQIDRMGIKPCDHDPI